MLVVITGGPGSGKTALCEAFSEHVRRKGHSCGGVVMRPTVADLPTDRVVVDVATGDSRPLTVPLGTPGAIPAGTAAYDPAALEWADEVTGRAHAHADVLIVDEIGALEIEGRGGLVGAMQLATNARRAVFTVRAGLVSAFLAKIGVGTTPVLAVAGGEIPAQVEELEKALHL